MTQADKTHFALYLDQTRTKHGILRSYLKPFFGILKKGNNNLLFVDGFAGRGSYTADGGTTVPGSPLIAIEVISSDPELSKRVQPLFIEANEEFITDLRTAVKAHLKTHPIGKEPQILHDECEAVLQKLADTKNIAPTFLFVDPCGVSGVSLPLICQILKQPGCELFLFLNYSGLARITGLAAKTGSSDTLSRLLGATEAAAVQKTFATASDERQREDILLGAVVRMLRESGDAEFVLPFRVEDRDSRRTSHYLIHATKHKLGFKIMKEVMWKAGKLEHEHLGRLELLQSSLKSGSLLLVRPDLDDTKSSIMAQLKDGPRTVSYFTEERVLSPDDLVAESAYRKLLLSMEAEGLIEVLDDDGTTLKPAAKRPARKGIPSLAGRLYVRLRRAAGSG